MYYVHRQHQSAEIIKLLLNPILTFLFVEVVYH